MAKNSSPSRLRSRHRTRSNAEEDKPLRRDRESRDDRNSRSHSLSRKSRSKFKSKHKKGKNINRKRRYHSSDAEDSPSSVPYSKSRLPKETNSEKYERTSKKRTSGSGDYGNPTSSTHSWDATLQKRSDVEEGEYMPANSTSGMHSWDAMLPKKSDVEEGEYMPEKKGSSAGNCVDPWRQKERRNTDGKDMHEKKGFASDDCWNSHSSWPSWDSWSQKERNWPSWDSWPQKERNWPPWDSLLQKKSGARDSKDISQNRVSSSSDHVVSRCHSPPSKSRWENRSGFGKDKALVHEGGHNSSNGASRWVSSSGRAWRSDLQIRTNAEGLKNTLEERTYRVIKSLKEDGSKAEVCSTKDGHQKRAQSSLNGARLLSRSPKRNSRTQGRCYKRDSTDSPGNSSKREESNEDATNMKHDNLMPNTTDHTGYPSNCASWDLKKKSNVQNSYGGSVERTETKVCPLESLQERSNSTDEAIDGPLLGTYNSIGAAENPCTLPFQNTDVHKTKDPKEVKNIFIKKAVDSYDQPSRDLEEQNIKSADEARDVHNKRVNIGIDSQAHTSCLPWISCREETNNLENEKGRPNEVAFDKSDGEGLRLGRASWESRIQIERPKRTGSTGYRSSQHSHDPNVQRRSNLEESMPESSKKDPNIFHRTELQSASNSHESNMQRSILEEPKAITDESHVQGKGTLEEPKDRPDERTLGRINGAEFPSMLPCVESKLQKTMSAEEIEVSRRKQQTFDPIHAVQFPFISMDYKMQKGNKRASERTDGAEFPSTGPCKELRLHRSIAADRTKVSPRKEESNLIHKVEFPFISRDYKLQKVNDGDAKDAVPTNQATTQVLDMDVACSKNFNASRLQNKVGGFAYSSSLQIVHGISARHKNYPAKERIWKGAFEVTDIASVVRLYEGFSAHPSFKVCRRAYEFSKKMSSTLDFQVQPRCNYWPASFKDCLDTNDIALYFYPKNEKAAHCYASLLKFIDNKDLMLRSQMGHVELLVFSSRVLDVNFQTIGNSYFFWGVFCAKRQSKMFE